VFIAQSDRRGLSLPSKWLTHAKAKRLGKRIVWADDAALHLLGRSAS
jgi:hypothetical protein